MSKAGIRAADWLQRGFTALLLGTSFYLGYKVLQGGKIVKTKIEGEQKERMERMERELKEWAAEDAAKKETTTKKD